MRGEGGTKEREEEGMKLGQKGWKRGLRKKEERQYSGEDKRAPCPSQIICTFYITAWTSCKGFPFNILITTEAQTLDLSVCALH